MNLYKLDEIIKQVIEQGFTFDEETGEILFESKDLDELQEALDTKLGNIIGYIKSLNMMADNMKSIKDEYSNRQKSYEKKAEYLKNYLDSWMKANSKTKLETDSGVASYRKSSSVNILDESLLESYIKDNTEYAKIEYKPNKTSIKEAINSGKSIPGVEIKENQNLIIK